MLGIVAKPATARVSIRKIIAGRKESKNPKADFAQSKKPTEVNDRKINRGIIFPEEPERGSRARFLKLRILLKRPDRMTLPAKVSSRAKHSRYVKIKG